MRRLFSQGSFTYPSVSEFPTVGKEDVFYRALDTNMLYFYDKVLGYRVIGSEDSGITILDGTGKVMHGDKLKILNGLLTEEPSTKTIILDLFESIRPFKPKIISPLSNIIDVPLAVKIVGSDYDHPYDIPIGETHWQIAKDADFTDLIMDRIYPNGQTTIIVRLDEHSVPYLEKSTLYYVRVKYIDIKNKSSFWSDPIVFTTTSEDMDDFILQPVILNPIHDGYIPEKRLIAFISTPEVIGSGVHPNKAELQIATDDLFDSGSIILDQVSNIPTVVTDPSMDLTFTPSPVFMRARHLDSVASVSSPYSPIFTVWLQRAFKDNIIGRETIVMGEDNITFNIDKNGNRISVAQSYFNNHPIFGSMVHTPVDLPISNSNYAPADKIWDFVYVPPFYVDCETVTKSNGDIHHRYWISPIPFGKGRGYLHPAFVMCPNGFLYGGALGSQLVGGPAPNNAALMIRYDQTALPNNNFNHATITNSIISDISANTQYELRFCNIYQTHSLLLLASIEYCTTNMQSLPGTVNLTNTNLSKMYRGIRSFILLTERVGTRGIGMGQTLSVASSIGVIRLGSPTNVNDMITYLGPTVMDVRTDTTTSAAYLYTYDIEIGYSNIMGYHMELIGVPTKMVLNNIGAGHSRYGTQRLTTSTWSLNGTAGVCNFVLTPHTFSNDTSNENTKYLRYVLEYK